MTITNTTNSDSYAAIEVTNGKQKAFIGRGKKSGRITVLNMNASHRAWMGGGRTFSDFEQAENAYKSTFMKTAISMAQEYI